ncbi:hypothetical protein Q8F55_008176 [Vanrija albida]|uniref:Uncharacterized protein n=1 Tax=Vanrija albida TaxID=181172 RepID=A0ABR3PVI8_9TREE
MPPSPSSTLSLESTHVLTQLAHISTLRILLAALPIPDRLSLPTPLATLVSLFDWEYLSTAATGMLTGTALAVASAFASNTLSAAWRTAQLLGRRRAIEPPPPDPAPLPPSPRLSRDDMDPLAARVAPRIVRTASDAALCLKLYRGPVFAEYPVSVIRSYVDHKLVRGRRPADIARKLEILEAELPQFARSFAAVRFFKGLGPSHVVDMDFPPVFDDSPAAAAAVAAASRLSTHVHMSRGSDWGAAVAETRREPPTQPQDVWPGHSRGRGDRRRDGRGRGGGVGRGGARAAERTVPTPASTSAEALLNPLPPQAAPPPPPPKPLATPPHTPRSFLPLLPAHSLGRLDD